MTQSGSGQTAHQSTKRELNDLDRLGDLTISVESTTSAAIQELLNQSADADTGSYDLKAPNCEFLVARLAGKPVGCIALVDHVRYGEARRLFVSEDMRGKGIAAALVEALEAAARDIGLRQIRIGQTARSPNTLHPFTSTGYRPVAGEWMEKAL